MVKDELAYSRGARAVEGDTGKNRCVNRNEEVAVDGGDIPIIVGGVIPSVIPKGANAPIVPA